MIHINGRFRASRGRVSFEGIDVCDNCILRNGHFYFSLADRKNDRTGLWGFIKWMIFYLKKTKFEVRLN